MTTPAARAIAPLVALGIALTGCNAISGLGNYHESDPAPDSARPSDAGDAGDTGDARIDAPPTPGCPPDALGAAFCDDFDDPTLGATSRFDFFCSEPDAGNGEAGVDRSDAEFVSPHASFQSATPYAPPAAVWTACLQKRFMATIGHVMDLDFEVQVDHVAPDGGITPAHTVVALVGLNPGTTGFVAAAIRLENDGTWSLNMQNGGASDITHTSLTPTLGSWEHIHLHIDATAVGNTSVSARIGTTDLGPKSYVLVAAQSEIDVRVGLRTNGELGPIGLHIDDVVLDVTPSIGAP